MRTIISALNACKDIREVENIYQKISSTKLNVQERAMLSYVNSWVNSYPPETPFLIDNFMSSDLSGILYGKVPVIFMGTNDWAEKRFCSYESLSAAMEKWNKHLSRTLLGLSVPVYFVVVPEKDVVVRNFSQMDLQTSVCEDVVSDFLAQFSESRSGFSFLDGVLNPLDKRVENYIYYDTHLLSRDYLNIYRNITRGFSLAGLAKGLEIGFKREVLYGDLDAKLNNPHRKLDFLHLFVDSGAQQIGGDSTFCTPLRDTFQSFKCAGAPVGGKVVICGDSHCSIYTQRKLTYLLANTFEYCDFYWDPLLMSGNISRLEDADFVVFEISERFLLS